MKILLFSVILLLNLVVGDYVWVRDVSDENMKRNLDSNSMPAEINLEIGSKSKKLSFKLKRNDDLNFDAPVTFQMEKNIKRHTTSRKLTNAAFYQDLERAAPFAIKRSDDGTYTIEGTFRDLDGTTFSIEAAKKDTIRHVKGLKHDQDTLHEIKELSDEMSLRSDYVELEDDLKIKVRGHEYHYKVKKGESINKRSGSIKVYNIEIIFVLDHTIWEYWINEYGGEVNGLYALQYFYSNIMNGMDLAFKSIDSATYGISITPWLKGYHIAKTYATSTWSVKAIYKYGSTYRTTFVNGDTLIETLGEFVKTNGHTWSNPDHAMLFTRYNLFGDNTIGYAPISGVCQYGRGISLVEARGFHTWTTASHELGHNLGASHDSNNNNCDGESYIMAAIAGYKTVDTISNVYKFSSCSQRYFADLLSGAKDSYPRVCAMNSVCKNQEPLVQVDYTPGELFSLDKQCQLLKGSFSKLCWNQGEGICYMIYCTFAEGGCWGRSPGAADGSPCATNKVCHLGHCIEKSKYPSPPSITPTSCTPSGMSTSVPSGCKDKGLKINIDNVLNTCEQIVTKYPHLCFTWSGGLYYCCSSCHKAGLFLPSS